MNSDALTINDPAKDALESQDDTSIDGTLNQNLELPGKPKSGEYGQDAGLINGQNSSMEDARMSPNQRRKLWRFTKGRHPSYISDE